MTSVVHLLANPTAGAGAAGTLLAIVRRRAQARGLETVDISGVDADDALRAARAAVANGAERLVVIGGDGVVHTAVQAVAQSATVLGVVPVGTGNDFVRGVGLLAESDEAIDAALGPATAIDAIRTKHGWIASVATAGFSADVNRRANALSWPRGQRRYTVATLREIPRLQLHAVTLTVDGVSHEMPVALIAVANTAWFGGGMAISPNADPTDGLLDVTVVRDSTRIEMLRFFPRVYAGTHLQHPKVSSYRGKSITIASDTLELWGDGECMGPTPVTLEAVPNAINLATG